MRNYSRLRYYAFAVKFMGYTIDLPLRSRRKIQGKACLRILELYVTYYSRRCCLIFDIFVEAIKGKEKGEGRKWQKIRNGKT